jgi:hypothetical protein
MVEAADDAEWFVWLMVGGTVKPLAEVGMMTAAAEVGPHENEFGGGRRERRSAG